LGDEFMAVHGIGAGSAGSLAMPEIGVAMCVVGLWPPRVHGRNQALAKVFLRSAFWCF
jgi:hypothetical protein